MSRFDGLLPREGHQLVEGWSFEIDEIDEIELKGESISANRCLTAKLC